MGTTRGLIFSLMALAGLFFVTNEGSVLRGLLGPSQQLISIAVLVPLCVLLLREPPPLPAGTARLQHELLRAAVVIGVFHVLSLSIGGLFSGFGQSPYGPGPVTLMVNVLAVGLTLVVVERARAFLIGSFSARGPALGVLLAAVGFTAASIPLLGLASAGSQKDAAGLLGGDWIPLLSEHMLASFIVYLGGSLPAIAYRAILAGFEWLSPVLPDLSWGLKSLIGTIVPVFGLMAVHTMSVGQVRGLARLRAGNGRSELPAWIAAAVAVVVLIWFTLGLMPLYPTVVAGGSMSPTLEYGDLVISAEAEASSVCVGDVIDFRLGEGNVIHRVVAAAGDDVKDGFITRGDASLSDDIFPVLPGQIRGKVVAVIPGAGWFTIALRNI